jgi:hypothetical protein
MLKDFHISHKILYLLTIYSFHALIAPTLKALFSVRIICASLVDAISYVL